MQPGSERDQNRITKDKHGRFQTQEINMGRVTLCCSLGILIAVLVIAAASGLSYLTFLGNREQLVTSDGSTLVVGGNATNCDAAAEHISRPFLLKVSEDPESFYCGWSGKSTIVRGLSLFAHFFFSMFIMLSAIRRFRSYIIVSIILSFALCAMSFAVLAYDFTSTSGTRAWCNDNHPGATVHTKTKGTVTDITCDLMNFYLTIGGSGLLGVLWIISFIIGIGLFRETAKPAASEESKSLLIDD
ncbi:hypothetical protein PROFUN_13180 [Planoprotostelium fungivorum]|uniref:Uncharacterized protein n=1 Tax=Planoprotostelium fungivorum TaxID=1890364 RepID=A0A2P6N560_9EUKA|nr:hypothetical protein PROFUN_13180 [Planoprotostelium fungivorum]